MNHYGLFNAKSSLYIYIILFLTIQFSRSHLFGYGLNSFIWLIDWILSGATSSGLRQPGSNVNEEVLYIL